MTDIKDTKIYFIKSPIDVFIASVAINNCKNYPDLSSETRKNICTIILELGTNIIKYADNGKIILQKIVQDNYTGIEIICVDFGPGISNTEKTHGVGLKVIKKLSDNLTINCPPEGGTHINVVIWENKNTT